MGSSYNKIRSDINIALTVQLMLPAETHHVSKSFWLFQPLIRVRRSLVKVLRSARLWVQRNTNASVPKVSSTILVVGVSVRISLPCFRFHHHHHPQNIHKFALFWHKYFRAAMMDWSRRCQKVTLQPRLGASRDWLVPVTWWPCIPTTNSASSQSEPKRIRGNFQWHTA